MNKKLEAKLVKAFPKLYRDYHGPMNQTCMHWGFECSDGWFELIWNLSEKLEPISKSSDMCASQVKEKFGTLRFYMTAYNEEVGQFVDAAVNASAFICEECGRAGKLRKVRGWLYTACDRCGKKIEKRFAKYPAK